ncbi:MAG: dTDP-4-dehydrorhamnose 3,5-epimerase [Candidatus Riflebacteria bacterium HGW-Riflebacteria-2]|jgi:dTDP-4-dehydrorhamnose 3,5-epimerase|nr:MAG: dTDP-4-dehydrorhamnose 3,5-epimerase [Candidatus Riflebacteria bacterium HGW-Riflebacteria-2]
MKVTPTAIPGVLVIEPQVFSDARGFFLETWNRRKFAEAGLDADFVQDNHSCSLKNTLRGLHYQLQNTQGKLVRVNLGTVFDVAVDIRRSSPTFGKWVGEVVSAENKKLFWVPPGFAHGFMVLSDVAEFQYKCTDYYNPAAERCIAFDDPDLAIDWPVKDPAQLILSAKDRAGKAFKAAELFA